MTPFTDKALDEWAKDLEPKPEPFIVEAVVRFNKGEALVLNRRPKLLYEFEGSDLVARDGPFVDFLRYERPIGKWKAFGGREFRFPMKDGTTTIGTGQYWSAGYPGCVSATLNTKESLLKCYVFTGCSAVAEEYEALRATYTGDVYPYEAYDALINAPTLRLKAWHAEDHFKKAKRQILSNLREIKKERDALLAYISGEQGQ